MTISSHVFNIQLDPASVKKTLNTGGHDKPARSKTQFPKLV